MAHTKLTDRARHLRQRTTDAERLIWSKIRNNQLGCKFRRQYPIDPYIVDFYCADHHFILEIDGGQHNPEVDQKRSAYIESKGYKIMRFWNNDVLTNIDGVLQTITTAMTDTPLTPTLSPQAGRGSDATLTNRILVAQISAVHGVRGLIKLACFCDDPGLIDGVPLYTDAHSDKTLTVYIHHFHKTHFLAEVDGVTDRDAAEKLRGTKLYLPRAKLPAITDEKTFYHVDLIGLAVTDTQGNECGRVLNVANFGAGDLLEIKPPSGPSYYLPFDDTHVPHVDIAAKSITIDAFEDWQHPK